MRSLAEARLIELLTEVDLQYLVKREGALTEAINWESEVREKRGPYFSGFPSRFKTMICQDRLGTHTRAGKIDSTQRCYAQLSLGEKQRFAIVRRRRNASFREWGDHSLIFS